MDDETKLDLTEYFLDWADASRAEFPSECRTILVSKINTVMEIIEEGKCRRQKIRGPRTRRDDYLNDLGDRREVRVIPVEQMHMLSTWYITDFRGGRLKSYFFKKPKAHPLADEYWYYHFLKAPGSIGPFDMD
jgi:hypothetical protein